MDDFELLQAIGDLIENDPLNAHLTRDPASWDRFCQGLDGITDAVTGDGRLAALNAVRTELGMEAIEAEGEGIPAAISAGLDAIRVELEERVNLYRESHPEPLSRLFPTGMDYLIEKVSASVRSCLPSEDSSQRDAAREDVDVLRASFEQLLREMRERGLDEGVRSDTENVVDVLRRATALLDGEPGIEPQDIYLLVTRALPVLVKSARRMATDIDSENAQREPGWTPPTPTS